MNRALLCEDTTERPTLIKWSQQSPASQLAQGNAAIRQWLLGMITYKPRGQHEGHMSKADRAKRRAKAKAATTAPKGVPVLAPIPKREGNGRASRAATPRDPHVEMLKARCRRWGKPMSQWREMRDPWWGCEAGGAMALAVPRLSDRKAFWDAICWMRRAVTAFDRVMGAPNRHAQCLRLMLPVDAMVEDDFLVSVDGSGPDDRTDEEKQDDAVRAYQWLGELSARSGPDAQAEAYRIVLDDQRPRDVAALLTVLRHISEVIDPRALT